MSIPDRIHIHIVGGQVKFDSPLEGTEPADLSGKQGYIKVKEGKFRTVTVRDSQGKRAKVDMGSLIDFLNVQGKQKDSNFKELDKNWVKGAGKEKVLLAFEKFKAASEGVKGGSFVYPRDEKESKAIIARHQENLVEQKALNKSKLPFDDFMRDFHVLLDAIAKDPDMKEAIKSQGFKESREIMRQLTIIPSLAFKYAPKLLESLKDNKKFSNNPKLMKIWTKTCFSLGRSFSVGHGFPQNYKQSIKFFELAADHGSTKALEELGWYYHQHFFEWDTHKLDPKKSVKYFQKAVEQGSTRVLEILAAYYEKGEGVGKNEVEAARLRELDRTAKLQEAKAQAALDASRKPVDSGISTVRQAFSHLVSLISPSASKKLTASDLEFLKTWKGEDPLNLEAVFQFLKSCRDRDVFSGTPGVKKVWVSACASLSRYYFCRRSYGRGLENNPEKGLEAILLADSDAKIQSSLGFLYKTGSDGVQKNPVKAFEYYKRAYDQGYPDAIRGLAECYENGIGVDESKEKAVELYQEALAKGVDRVLIDLARCYENGIGVELNKQEAIRFYRLALAKGFGVGLDLQRLGLRYPY